MGTVLFANTRARRRHITPGMRYNAVLALHAGTRAAVVSPERLNAVTSELTERLISFSPDVEPIAFDGGAFWINLRGMDRLYPSEESWVAAVTDALRQRGFFPGIALGHRRFSTYLAAALHGHAVLAGRGAPAYRWVHDEADEAALLRSTPLEAVVRDPRDLLVLRRLGVTDVAQFIALSLSGVKRRFSKETLAVHRMANSRWELPVQSTIPLPPARRERRYTSPISSRVALAGACMALFDEIVAADRGAGGAVASCRIELETEGGRRYAEIVSPGRPSTKRVLWGRLIELRLERVHVGDGVTYIAMQLELAAAEERPATLFSDAVLSDADEGSQRDGGRTRDRTRALEEAFADLRARLGNGAVLRILRQPSHLPERSFSLAPMKRVTAAIAGVPRSASSDPASIDPASSDRATGDLHQPLRLVRVILTTPTSVSMPERYDLALNGLENPDAEVSTGAHRLASPADVVTVGWWDTREDRVYRHVFSPDRSLRWVYYDQVRNRWMHHGVLR